jgi:thiamine-monophosphate kinase
MKLSQLGEIGLIRRIAKMARTDASVVRGIGDDTAVIKWKRNKYLLATCDMLVEDVHFRRRSAKPFQIGWKAMARNLSDIAAMGGIPRYALVSAGLPAGISAGFAEGIYRGIDALAGRFKVNIVGGDTTRSDKIVIDISLIGEVEKNILTLRSGAKKGDAVLVTGSIGGSIKGRHLNFIPRVKEARTLVNGYKINSMIDVSDGLAIDMWRVLEASNRGARIYSNAVPLNKDAGAFEEAVRDGEDFELLFTMSKPQARRLIKSRRPLGVTPVTLIGEITDKARGFVSVDEYGKEKTIRPEGYIHFR